MRKLTFTNSELTGMSVNCLMEQNPTFLNGNNYTQRTSNVHPHTQTTRQARNRKTQSSLKGNQEIMELVKKKIQEV